VPKEWILSFVEAAALAAAVNIVIGGKFCRPIYAPGREPRGSPEHSDPRYWVECCRGQYCVQLNSAHPEELLELLEKIGIKGEEMEEIMREIYEELPSRAFLEEFAELLEDFLE